MRHYCWPDLGLISFHPKTHAHNTLQFRFNPAGDMETGFGSKRSESYIPTGAPLMGVTVYTLRVHQ